MVLVAYLKTGRFPRGKRTPKTGFRQFDQFERLDRTSDETVPNNAAGISQNHLITT